MSGSCLVLPDRSCKPESSRWIFFPNPKSEVRKGIVDGGEDFPSHRVFDQSELLRGGGNFRRITPVAVWTREIHCVKNFFRQKEFPPNIQSAIPACTTSRKLYHGRMKMLLEVPEKVVAELAGSDAERKRELMFTLACGLFASGELSSGLACELSGMSRLGFLDEYGRRGLSRPYSEDDLADDLAFATRR